MERSLHFSCGWKRLAGIKKYFLPPPPPPPLKPTFTLTSHLGKNVGLGEGRWAVSQKRMMIPKDTNPPLYKQQGILAELAFAKSSGIVAVDGPVSYLVNVFPLHSNGVSVGW